MKSNSFFLCVFIFWLFGLHTVTAQKLQKDDEAIQPIKIDLNDDGSQYIRFIMWQQIWLTTNNLAADQGQLQLSTSIRRSRYIAYAQLTDKFLVLTHFGLNGLNTNNIIANSTNGKAAQFYLHAAWGEMKLNEYLYIGAGLHYWRGLTRVSSLSSTKSLTLDQSKPYLAWHSMNITDQSARHLGLYMKGDVGKLQYRFALNSPAKANLENGKDYGSSFYHESEPLSQLTYTGVSVKDKNGLQKGNQILEGYVKWDFWEKESSKLPSRPGSYLGQKSILSVGAGFFIHPNGMYDNLLKIHRGVTHFALDAYLDIPTHLGAFHTYIALYDFNYGPAYIGRWAGTGKAVYGEAGVFLKEAKMMPYVSFSHSDFDGAVDVISSFDLGVNYYLKGQHAKLTIEYHNIGKDFREGELTPGGLEHLTQLRMQFQIYL